MADELDAQAEVTGKSFVEVFRNEYGYLLDYVDGNMMDWSVRPNMIFTVAFVILLWIVRKRNRCLIL